MINLKIIKIVKAPIEKVWDVLINEFAEIEKWATGVFSSQKTEDYDRVCKTSFGNLEEKILTKDKKQHILQFKVKGFPFFVKSAVSTWTLKEISKTETEVTVNPNIKTMPIIGTIMEIPMKMQLKKAIPGLMDDFATYVETGKASKSKQEEIDKK